MHSQLIYHLIFQTQNIKFWFVKYLDYSWNNNSVDYSKDGIYSTGFHITKFAYGSNWILLNHQNSTNEQFFLSTNNCNYTSENLYSIVSSYDYISTLKHFKYITLLLEYKQLNSYQIWKQNISLLEIGEHEYIRVRGDVWEDFAGLMYSKDSICLDFNGNAIGWWYSIGVFDHGYKSHFPGPIINGIAYKVLYADLWIELHNIKQSCLQPLKSYLPNIVPIIFIILE